MDGWIICSTTQYTEFSVLSIGSCGGVEDSSKLKVIGGN